MNVSNWAEYAKITDPIQQQRWIRARRRMHIRKNNLRIDYKLKRAVEAYRATLTDCTHRTFVTVFEPGQGPSTREEAEVSYCTDTCGQVLTGVAS